MSRSKPLAMLVTRNDELVSVYPGILGGNSLIKARDIADGVIELTHECTCCGIYLEHCPIMQSMIWYYCVHKKQRITGFNWVRQKVTLQRDWQQIQLPRLFEVTA